jgi:23S rRNA (uridine2552-2'-O)-methyltransferase
MLQPLDKFLSRSLKQVTKTSFAFKSGASSNIWLERQRRDPYVKRAVKESYRARSAFKLIEMDAKYKFIKPGDVIIDIGASPGSWSQVAVQKTNSNGAGK